MPAGQPVVTVTEADRRALFASGQWGYYCTVNAGSPNSIGFLANMTAADTTNSAAEDATGRFITQGTGAVINTTARIAADGSKQRLDQFPLQTFKWRLNDTIDIRFLCAILEIMVGNVNADNVGSNAVGIQFSTGRGDVNFQFVVNDGAVQNLVDSGIPADTLPHFCQINAVAGDDVTVSLLDANFVLQASTRFTTVNPELPVETVDMGNYCGIRNLAAVAKSIDQYYGTVLLRNS